MSTPAPYTKHERIWMKDHPDFNERWVQRIIAQDCSILGLGDLSLLDRERIHRGAGRLDLLLRDQETSRRYELELQLGETDESHIIRTIEYWDIERKRYPQYDHCAVIVAEDITSRFLNVVSLFNGSIPLIAMQMQLIKVGSQTTLVFSTVMNELKRGLVDGDEPQSVPADRAYWENGAGKETLAICDDLLKLAQQVDSSLTLNYTKSYIGITKGGQPFNFLWAEQRKGGAILVLKLTSSEYVDSKIDAADFDTLSYAGGYRLRLRRIDITEKDSALEELIRLAYEQRRSDK